jgi:quercetin dioxygenase-like cupin family protein
MRRTPVLSSPSCLICINAPGRAPAQIPRDMSAQPLIDLSREQVLSLARETQFAAHGIVSRTLLQTPHGRIVLFGFAAGQELTEHTTTQHAVVQILSGECEFSTEGKPNLLRAGDVLYMPPNLRHAVKATQPFSMLLTLFKPAAPAGA